MNIVRSKLKVIFIRTDAINTLLSCLVRQKKNTRLTAWTYKVLNFKGIIKERHHPHLLIQPFHYNTCFAYIYTYLPRHLIPSILERQKDLFGKIGLKRLKKKSIKNFSYGIFSISLQYWRVFCTGAYLMCRTGTYIYMPSYIHIYYADSTISLRNTFASTYRYFLQHLTLSILEQAKYIGSRATKVNPLSANRLFPE